MLLVIAQSAVGELYGADGADQIAVGGIRLSRLKEAVLPLYRHVIHAVGQKDQIVSLPVELFDDPVIKQLQKLLVLKLRIPEGHQKPVHVPVHLLIGVIAAVMEELSHPSREDG